MKYKAAKLERKKLTILIALVFLSIVTTLITASYVIFRIEADANHKTVSSQQTNEISQQQDLFRLTFETIEADLNLLAGHNDLSHLINTYDKDKKTHLVALQDELFHFIDHKKTYDKVRFINMAGDEVIRVNNEQGKARIVPPEELQNKANRYYFDTTLNLKRNQIFISPLDLNMERGEVESPQKPIIRFGLSIYDQHGNKQGIFVLSYLAENLLHSLKLNAKTKDHHLLLVNADGYWLKAISPKEEWGFMYKEKENEVMAMKFPLAWKKISTQESGQFVNNKGMFTFNSIHPLSNQLNTSTNFMHYQVLSNNYVWKIISFHPLDKLVAHKNATLKRYIWMNIFLILVLAITFFSFFRLKLKALDSRRALKEKDALVHNVVKTAFDGIVTINAYGVITSFNPAALAMFGYEKHEVIGENIKLIIPSPHHEKHSYYLARYIKTLEPHIIGIPRELEGVSKSGEKFPIELCVSAKESDDEWLFIGMIRDIRERKAMQEKLERMATTDDLTQVYNRGFFSQQLKHELNRATRYNQKLSLILLDVDWFKSVNDEFGHPAGDAMLVTIARAAKKMSRDIDFVTRYGGEEFAIILPETDQENAFICAERLRKEIAGITVVYDGNRIQRTISIGVACLSAPYPKDIDHFIKMADDALYHAKKTGRNKSVVWTQALNQRAN